MSNFSVLLDMDGVMLNTEPLYDKFWEEAAVRYNISIPNFARVIKGTTLPNILKQYFSEYSQEEINQLIKDVDDCEANMIFDEIPGSIDFVKTLKEAGVKVGLVTSSTSRKMVEVNKQREFDLLFDTIITAEHVTHGKPNPECFLIGARNLGGDPKNCFVFEDSHAGIQAGTAAGMRVIGLSTTLGEEAIKDKCLKVIPDFKNITIEDLKQLL